MMIYSGFLTFEELGRYKRHILNLRWVKDEMRKESFRVNGIFNKKIPKIILHRPTYCK
jgi:hypothetical protein